MEHKKEIKVKVQGHLSLCHKNTIDVFLIYIRSRELYAKQIEMQMQAGYP